MVQKIELGAAANSKKTRVRHGLHSQGFFWLRNPYNYKKKQNVLKKRDVHRVCWIPAQEMLIFHRTTRNSFVQEKAPDGLWIVSRVRYADVKNLFVRRPSQKILDNFPAVVIHVGGIFSPSVLYDNMNLTVRNVAL